MPRAPIFAYIICLLAAASCGGSDATTPDGPLSGTFTGTLAAGAKDSSGTFTISSTRSVSVSICGPMGADFNLDAGGFSSSTASNCEHTTFVAVAGHPYRVVVTAASGSGAFTGCWNTGSTACVAPTPVGMLCTGDVPGDSDATIPAGYYTAAHNACGSELIAALTSIVSNQRVLGYTSARDSMYAYIDDLDNDDVIEDLYTGRLASGVNSRQSAFLAHLNAEHSWPQSRGAAEDPAMSDLNHLFACDSTANIMRENYPYGVVTGTVMWQSTNPPTPGDFSRLGRDASGQIVFEPRPSRRGDVARAAFYFYLRYNTHRTASFTLSDFTKELSTLLQWNIDDPVSVNERTRNALVYRAQGNRNPFIDAPQFVAAIGSFR